MQDVVNIIAQHGYAAVFLIVLAEALGLPVPASVAMVAAGAAVASHHLSGLWTLLLCVAALGVGDSVLYLLGRQTGWALLGFLCKLSANPETCILRSA